MFRYIKYATFLRQWLLVSGVLLLTTCDHSGTMNPDDQLLDQYWVRLENQLEHSGIMVQIVELDTLVVTDSTGAFNFENLPDGNYTLDARYPYFASGRDSVVVKNGEIEGPVHLELEQQLQFWIEPAETTLSQSNTYPEDRNTFILSGLRQYRVNILMNPSGSGYLMRQGTFLR